MSRPDDRILVVEDDSDVRTALAAVLETHGYSVVEAENGRQALDRLRDRPGIRLILLDLFMPEMDGWTFRAEQKKDPAHAAIPVVIMSADSVATKGALAPPGVIAAMTKPVELDQLLQIVDRYC